MLTGLHAAHVVGGHRVARRRLDARPARPLRERPPPRRSRTRRCTALPGRRVARVRFFAVMVVASVTSFSSPCAFVHCLHQPSGLIGPRTVLQVRRRSRRGRERSSGSSDRTGRPCRSAAGTGSPPGSRPRRAGGPRRRSSRATAPSRLAFCAQGRGLGGVAAPRERPDARHDGAAHERSARPYGSCCPGAGVILGGLRRYCGCRREDTAMAVQEVERSGRGGRRSGRPPGRDHVEVRRCRRPDLRCRARTAAAQLRAGAPPVDPGPPRPGRARGHAASRPAAW